MNHSDPDLLQTAPPKPRPEFGPDAVFCTAAKGSEGGPTLNFFRDRTCFRWDVVKETLIEPPRPIEDAWPGLLEAGNGARLRAALHVPAWGPRVFFIFAGQHELVVWDLEKHAVTGRQAVHERLPSVVTQGDFTPVSAQLADGTPVIYGFHDRDYTRWAIAADGTVREEAGFPRRTQDDWKEGLVFAPRAGVYVDWPSRSSAHSNRKIYFFLGNLYLRWDVPSNTRNYRLDILAGWKGWPTPS